MQPSGFTAAAVCSCAHRRTPHRHREAMPSQSPWFEGLEGTPAWMMMQEALQKAKVPGASWQNLLAVHTSTCCSPGKEDRMVSSLEEAGLNRPVTDIGTNKVLVQLVIPELFPDMRFGAHSGWHDPEPQRRVPHFKAKEEVCFDTLTFALLMAPHLVRIHPNSVKEAAVSIAKLRSLGECTMMADGVAKRWQALLKTLPPTVELVSPKSGASSSGAIGSGGAGAGAGGGAGGPPEPTHEEKEAQAQALICAHYAAGPQWLNPSHLKRPVFTGLKELLPKRSLRPFLEARPTLFATRTVDGSKAWEFQRIA